MPVGSPATRTVRSTAYRLTKRALDLLLAIPLAVVFSPLALVVGVLIRRKDNGPALYRAARVGQGGEEFTMYKFRTMVTNAEGVGGSSTSAEDPRITPLGHWLRRWKLDELPQLINVLRGDMSLVGPRPQVGWDVARYTPEERRILSVPPGITDWASIRFRDEGEILKGEADPDEAYDRLIRPGKIALGLAYVDNASLRQDVSILAATAKAVAGYQPKILGPDLETTPNFSRITEGWETRADAQQWELASQRYSLAAALARDADLVEVGCGTGYGLAAVAPYAKRVLGVEPDARNLAIARAKAPHCEFVQGSADKLSINDASVDCIAALETYYYMPDQIAFLAEARRVLRPGGRLLLTMPNPERPAFQPSPFSSRYPTPNQLVTDLRSARFTVELFGCCPLENVSRANELLRRILVRLHLIPRTLEGRARLKRLMYRSMRPLGSIRVDPETAYCSLTALDGSADPARYAVVVAIAIPQ